MNHKFSTYPGEPIHVAPDGAVISKGNASWLYGLQTHHMCIANKENR